MISPNERPQGAIKLIHTSDWHLGKRLYRKERQSEHLLFLNWLEDFLKKEKVDVLLLAGDVFDSPTPPHESLRVYYDFLKRVSDIGIHTVIISGNHDSQGLINAPQALIEDKKIILRSRIDSDLEKNIIKLNIKGQEVWIKSMPYFRNYELIKFAQEHSLFEEEKPREDVFTSALDKFLEYWPEGEPGAKILLSHHVFGNYSLTGSEHFIGLTGIESIPMGMIHGRFDYAALGHIHKYQSLGTEDVAGAQAYYTGSPIQMRFSESPQKHINLLELKENPQGQAITTSKVDIPIFRELIQIKTNSKNFQSDIEKRLESPKGELEPFVEVQMDMLESASGLADAVKEICDKNAATLLSFLPNIKNTNYEEETKTDLNELNIIQLFKRFYGEKFPEAQELPSYLLQHFKTLMEESEDENS